MVVILATLALGWVFGRYTSGRRSTSADQIRAEWGKPLSHWRDFDAIAEYHQWRARAADRAGFLDDRTWEDLNLDLVFKEIDRTRSTIGRQALYHRIRSAPGDDELAGFEHLVQHFTEREPERVRAQILLSRVSHAAGYRLWQICQEDGVQGKWWYALSPFLAAAAVGSIIGFIVWPRALLILLGVAIANIVLRVKLQWHVEHLLGPFRQIGPLLECADYLVDPSVAGIAQADIEAHLRSVHSLRSAAKWASREISFESELAASTWEYLNVLFLFDANSMLLARRTLRKNGPALLRIIELVGEVDAAISTASLRAGVEGWSIPTFTDVGNPTVLRDVSHPLLEDAVANSIVLHPGQGLIVTGSNMSGKSTFLRTVGLSTVLAQSLNTCPARSYSSPRLTVRSAIGRSDDLSAGKSYYLVEVETVLELLRDSTTSDPHLFLFDELFRGTNTIERLAAGEAVLNALLLDASGHGRHIVLAATHDIELVDMLATRYDPYHFEESVQPDGLSFDYLIRPGPARARNAIALLELCGAPESIVTRARETAAMLDSVRSHESDR